MCVQPVTRFIPGSRKWWIPAAVSTNSSSVLAAFDVRSNPLLSLHRLLKRAPDGALFACLLLLCSTVWAPSAWALCDLDTAKVAAESAQVAAVYDGDTLELKDGRRVRMIGINTPERARKTGEEGEPLSNKARKALEDSLSGGTVWLVQGKQGKDHYGRMLAHVFSDKKDNVTAQLLRVGLGFQVAIAPNLQFLDCYRDAELHARQNRLGVWNHPYYQPVHSTSDALKGGYARVFGAVERVSLSKKAIWIDLEGHVTLKLEKHDAPYVDSGWVDELVQLSKRRSPGWVLEVRGWMSDRMTWSGTMPEQVRRGKRKRFQMKIHHQIDWKQIDATKTVN